MAIIIRFVSCDGHIRERFFDIVSVHDTNSSTLKSDICKVFSKHSLLVSNMRGQRYDGASNMHGDGVTYKHYFSMIVYMHIIFIALLITFN
ncbi:hypothetical protein L3X38_033498 [Prunus dulcis]|uniref:DUF4371 domain-containing protein n=1 Tax=Prunus dulcis TaxID=3755 RepID=A0AAD4VG22_PRUDU|nr:hypothetical protein L3X38_033498 [Prunus dulcis]